MKNPNLIPKPFAQNGQKDAIPANHKSDLPSQKATWDTGFPQITMMPVTAGGLPPSGRDFNGILNQISDNIVYLSQGGKFKYSQEYADSTGGYPKGAILQSDDETREFQSLVDNNKINFNKESSEKVNAAWKQVNTTQLLDELNKKLNRSDVVQSVGNSKAQVMSQNAVTDALNTKQDKGDYATNSALNQVNDNANSRVPAGRKVNGKDLSSDITLSAGDVNAYTRQETDNRTNTRLEKAKNGADIPDKPGFMGNLGFTGSLHTPGYVVIPLNNRKLVIQWGAVSIPIAGSIKVSYPLSVGRGLAQFVSSMDTNPTNNYRVSIADSTNNTITLTSTNTHNITGVMWLAIGEVV
ncbi:hypothetical protein [Xenorhabdus sp. KJ12.1]|uniref:gp53-like domain-containing protein n=1 Tax=Xenorhabdus sp. KJ12.1 TaxID=1851571 RepID=UPI000C03B2B3|nr:hypothetical protein [Xenorhabdus sp. KJ12.1]PHM67900.1 hypothetical protein Xekj_03815 [Xenorhabdus sp. KJ12.1]